MGLFKSIGNIFNDITGATSAAKTQYKYNKEFTQNAHQWEVADLEKAGLNPILSADGSGAQGNVSAVQGSGANMATSMLNSILDYNIMGKQNEIAQQDVDAKTTLADAQTKKTDAETTEQILKNKYVEPEKKAKIANIVADTKVKEEEKELTSANKTIAEQQRWMNLAVGDKLNQEADAAMWENFKNASEAKFVQKYGVTKDQAIEIYKATGQIVGNFIPKMKKQKPNTKTTSAKKGTSNGIRK